MPGRPSLGLSQPATASTPSTKRYIEEMRVRGEIAELNRIAKEEHRLFVALTDHAREHAQVGASATKRARKLTNLLRSI